MTPGRVIGRRGQLPWHLSADLRRFRQLTMGHHVIMGRKTYESIGRPLPGRKLVVVSRQRELVIPDVHVAADLPAAVAHCQGDDEIFFAGGEQVYREALEIADRIYLTIVHAEIEGDAYFPVLPSAGWQVVEQHRHSADERNEYDYSFHVMQRAGK